MAIAARTFHIFQRHADRGNATMPPITASTFFGTIALSVFGGHCIVAVSLYIIRRTVPGQKNKLTSSLDCWIGATERTIATTILLFAPKYLAPFIGGWVVLKLAANWQRQETSLFVRQGTLIALIGNALSFSTVIIAVWLIYPHALEALTK